MIQNLSINSLNLHMDELNDFLDINMSYVADELNHKSSNKSSKNKSWSSINCVEAKKNINEKLKIWRKAKFNNGS